MIYITLGNVMVFMVSSLALWLAIKVDSHVGFLGVWLRDSHGVNLDVS